MTKPQSKPPEDPLSLRERFVRAAVNTCRGDTQAMRRRATEFRVHIASCCAGTERCKGCGLMAQAVEALEREAEKQPNAPEQPAGRERYP